MTHLLDPGAYILPAGPFAGQRLDEVPDSFLRIVAAKNWNDSVRELAEMVLADRSAELLEDPLQVAEPSGELAAAVLPLLTYLWEQRMLGALGTSEPGPTEAQVLECGIRCMRELCSSFTDRGWPSVGAA